MFYVKNHHLYSWFKRTYVLSGNLSDITKVLFDKQNSE